MRDVLTYDLGHAPYRPVWDLQTAIQQRLIDEKQARRKQKLYKPQRQDGDVLLFVEHPHVYTLGKSGDSAHLLKGLQELSDIDADIHKYLRYLEEVIIQTCVEYDIEAGRIDGLTGVWVGQEKICAMGIRCSRWVTMHGFALNVNTDLDYFNHIVPCGITDKEVTSLEKLLGHPVDPDEVKSHLIRHFENIFDVRIARADTLPELEEEFSYLNPSAKAASH